MQSAITRCGPGLVGPRLPGVASTTIVADRGGAFCCGAVEGAAASAAASTSACAPLSSRNGRPQAHRHHRRRREGAAAAAPATAQLATCATVAISASPAAARRPSLATPGPAAAGAGAAALMPLLSRRREGGDCGGAESSAGGGRRRGGVACRAGVLEGFSGVSNLMAPEFATVFSAIIAITSVSINLYGGLLTEKRRAELAREVERERQVMAAADEERSVVARYRGPLLEATVDLEARLYHIATLTAEWRSGEVVCEEEVVYTLFTLAQWLGFLEVIRREGPRERSFLQRGGGGDGAGAGGHHPTAGAAAAGGSSSGGGGTDTLTTLVESFRFVLSAHPATLRKWYEQGDEEREHPGCRSRALMLRGTPALPEDWSDADTLTYGSGGYWRERPPTPPPGAAWPRAVAASAGPSLGGGGGFTVPYGPMRGGGGQSSYSAALPPPPTKRVVLYDSAPAAWGSGPPTGTVVGSELVIGSLNENDLAAAGLGLPDLDMSRSDGDDDNGNVHSPRCAAPASSTTTSSNSYSNGTGQGPAVGAAASSFSGAAGAAAAAPPLPTGSSWDAAAAADLYAGSLGSLSSLSSLSSFDEGGFALGHAGGGGVRRSAPRDVFHVSRGSQRSIGSMMVVTPTGASRHYTLSYGDFYNRYYMDDFFASWLRPVHTDILALVGGRRWREQGPFPLNRWTRLLLLQQLLVETIELLDPAHVRVPANRRVVLAPVPYKQAPELEAYRARMREMSQLDSPLLMQHLQESQANGPVGQLLGWVRGAAASASAAVATATAGADAQPAAQTGAAPGAAPQGGALALREQPPPAAASAPPPQVQLKLPPPQQQQADAEAVRARG